MNNDSMVISNDYSLRYFTILNAFAMNLLGQESMEDIAWSVAKDGIAHLGFKECVIYGVDGDNLIQMAAHGSKNPERHVILNPVVLPIGQGIVGNVAATGNPEIVNDTSMDRRYIIDDVQRYSLLAVPVWLGKKVIGVICAEHDEKDFFTDEHKQILIAVASITGTKLSQAFSRKAILDGNMRLEAMAKKRASELEAALKDIQSINQELQQFAYTVSHDLRAPVSAVVGFIGLIDKEGLSGEDSEFLESAATCGRHVLKLVDDLLQYARTGGVGSDDFEIVNLNDVLREVRNMLDQTIKENQVSLLTDGLPEVHGVRLLLVQLFQNLISNAIKFKADSPPIITVEARLEQSQWHITVTDNGRGIPEAQIRKIFDVFFRGIDSEHIEGNGIGLTVCRKIVKEHHGTIWATSEPGMGSIFHILIPVVQNISHD
jgi:signal transduction histidine kinase